MSASWLRGVLLVVSVSLILFAGSSEAARRWDVQVVGNDPGPYFYNPDTLSIAYGDTVRWFWVSGSHTATEYDGNICTGGGPESRFDGLIDALHPTFSVVFDQSIISPPSNAVVLYECTFHCFRGMNGAILVQATGVPPGPLPGEGDPGPTRLEQSWGRIKATIFVEPPP